MEKDAYHEKEMLPEKEEDFHTSSASETFENSGSESFGDDGFDLFSSIENLIYQSEGKTVTEKDIYEQKKIL